MKPKVSKVRKNNLLLHEAKERNMSSICWHDISLNAMSTKWDLFHIHYKKNNGIFKE